MKLLCHCFLENNEVNSLSHVEEKEISTLKEATRHSGRPLLGAHFGNFVIIFDTILMIIRDKCINEETTSFTEQYLFLILMST